MNCPHCDKAPEGNAKLMGLPICKELNDELFFPGYKQNYNEWQQRINASPWPSKFIEIAKEMHIAGIKV